MNKSLSWTRWEEKRCSCNADMLFRVWGLYCYRSRLRHKLSVRRLSVPIYTRRAAETRVLFSATQKHRHRTVAAGWRRDGGGMAATRLHIHQPIGYYARNFTERSTDRFTSHWKLHFSKCTRRINEQKSLAKVCKVKFVQLIYFNLLELIGNKIILL